MTNTNVPGEPELEIDDEEDDVVIDPAEPTDHERAGGAGRELSLVWIITAIAGLIAAVNLLQSEIARAENPDAALLCDVSPFLNCSNNLDSWQSSLFGLSNSIVGIGVYSAVLAVGIALLAGARLPRLIWQLMVAGVSAFLVVVLFFIGTSFFHLGTMCPNCIVVWVTIPPLLVTTVARAAQAGHVRLGQRLTRTLVMDRWLIVAALYVLLVVGAGIRFNTELIMLLR